jgi:hypothetical protein
MPNFQLPLSKWDVLVFLGVGWCALGVAACAARALRLPTDAGTPWPDAAAVHAEIVKSCSGVRTLSAELRLSGRAGRDRLRGRVLAGFERPASMRLEGVAPFGAPAFILTARGDTAVLLLPRDDRVLRDERAEDILGALTGVSLGPADLQAILSGCVVPESRVAAGRLHRNRWASIELAGGATLFLQQTAGRWQLRAARRGPWQIEYREWQGAFPQTVRLVSTTAGSEVDVTAEVAQLETNVDLDAAAFTVDIPRDATPLTLEELRTAGPLRGTAAPTSRRGTKTPNSQLDNSTPPNSTTPNSTTPKLPRPKLFGSWGLGVGTWYLGVESWELRVEASRLGGR